MLVILLRDLSRIHVVLSSPHSIYRHFTMHEKTHLDDFLIRHTSKEYMLLVLVWMESDNIGNFTITKALQTLPCFCVPQFHLTVVTAGQELATVIGKCHVFYSFCMAMERTKAISMRVHVPELAPT